MSSPQSPPRPRVHVLSLGGTIAMTGGPHEGVAPTLTADALVAAVPGIDQLAQVTAEQFRQLPGASLTVSDIQQLARRIAALAGAGCEGIVVTQGTDTIEETAFLLDLLVSVDIPVVVTGAMRNPTMPGADGPANLLGAVLTATESAAQGAGVLVVMNDEIHAARFVTKRHTTSPAAFVSPLAGPVGWIMEGKAHLVARVAPRRPIKGGVDAQVPPVALVTLALGDDARLTDQLEPLGYRGVVVQALGGGHAPAAAVDRLASLAGVMPVVLAPRTGAGAVLAHTYRFRGSEQDLLDRGLLHAGWLDGPKARILLGLGLGAGLDLVGLADVFGYYGGFARSASRNGGSR